LVLLFGIIIPSFLLLHYLYNAAFDSIFNKEIDDDDHYHHQCTVYLTVVMKLLKGIRTLTDRTGYHNVYCCLLFSLCNFICTLFAVVKIIIKIFKIM